MKNTKQIVIAFSLMLAVVVVGTTGYLILGWDLLDAAYMTVITVTTVGLKEVRALDVAGKIFTMFLAVAGLFVVMSGAGLLATKFIEVSFDRFFGRRRRMEQKITSLENHIIICGVGQVGEIIVHEFMKASMPFVVMEKNNDIIQNLMEKSPDVPVMHGDATDDEMLIKAGIEKAKGLITVLPNDSENLFVVMSARGLNSKLRIITRAEFPENVRKMRKAGADYVVSNVITGGMRMASLMLRPDITSFLDVVTGGENIELRVEQVEIPPKSPLSNLNLLEARIPQSTGLIVIALKDAKDGKFLFNPTSSTVLKENDKVIVLGNSEQIDKLVSVIRGWK